MRKTTILALTGSLTLALAAGLRADEEHKHEGSEHKDTAITVTGEILDMACYLDHGARGKDHKDCAETCIESGLPVGIKSDKDGKTYLIIGAHKPLNEQLAKHAAETTTIRGKLVTRDGISMIANARIVK